MKKIFSSIRDLVNLSKLTKTKNKKLRIIFSAALSNLVVVSDILIITTLTSIFTKNNYIKNFVVDFFVENLELLPFIIVLRFLSIYFEKMNVIKLKIKIEESLRNHLLSEIFEKGNYSTSDAYFYVNTISNQVANFYGTFATFLGSLLQIFAYAVYLLFTNTETVTVFFIGAIVLAFPTLYLTKLGRKYSHSTYVYGQEISSEIENTLDNLYLIKIINYVDRELLKFKESNKNYFDSLFKNFRFGTINAIIPNFLTTFLVSILLVFFNFTSKLTLDFIGIVLRLFQALGVFNSNFHLLNAYHVYTEKLFRIETNKVEVTKNNFVLDNNLDSKIAIEFKNVSFKYFGENQPLFEELNLKFLKNKHTIITGPNGSGKSSLLALTSGIVYPNNGSVTVYKSSFSYVSASPMILNGTLKENLLYGVDKIHTEEKLYELVREFQVFNELDFNLKKNITNTNLSMGQMQKISFIRALLSQSEILLLDESTSNLDIESKKLIFNILSKENLTIINATHNPEEFLNYDLHLKIKIENGKRIIY